MQSEFTSEIITSINNKESIVFCGAGISRNSGLPTVDFFMKYVFKRLGLSQIEQEIIFKANLPFEAFIETLKGHSKIDKIFDIYDAKINGAGPNSNHLLLAQMIKLGKLKTIVTTNFDQLIEEALAFGPDPMNAEEHYDLLYKEEDFDKIDWTVDRIRLIKIHGSIHDKKNMSITLSQVASRKVLSSRKKVVDYVYSQGEHKNVLVLGYSCSDVFDISPQIEAIDGILKNVCLIDHLENGDPTSEAISVKKEKNPFKKFNGSRILCNTDTLIADLWQKVFNKVITIQKTSILWEQNVDAWYFSTEQRLNAGRFYIIGYIFFKISQYAIAFKYYEQALQIVRSNGDKRGEWLIRILNELDTAKPVHTTDLAEEFNVSVRTAQRDISLLDKAGFPIVSPQKGQYSFVDGFSLKKISVSHDEASLMALFYELSESLGGRFPKVYSGILKKLFSPNSDTPYFIKMPEVIRKDFPVLEVIESGIEQSKTARIVYDKPKEQKAYLVWPLKIVNYEGFWYLLARLDENEHIRTFRLEKIKEAKLLDRTFNMPDNLKILLDNSVNIWFSNKRDKEIVLKAEANIAGYFKQKKYFPCQKIIKTEKDGSILISTTVGQYEEALHVMMTWLPHIKVIKPPEFKEILSQILKESLKNI